MSRRRSNLFLHINSEPNPDSNPGLWEHRLRQRRPLSRNPFISEDSAVSTQYEVAAVESPGPSRQATYDPNQPSDTSKANSKEELHSENPNLDIEWGDQAPGWLNLFYDLAWTATFSSLTSNNKFKQPWDSVSYIVFFTIAWWMWTSQVFYSIDFYTNDWFHLLVVFLQLIIFGALAATTRGFDVSTYILHSPGSAQWEDTNIETITPQQYSNERVAKVSLVAISIVVALSRLLLLVQHIRVAIYAKFTHRSRRYPVRLLLVPVSLAISTALFFVAFVITKRHGTEATAAKVKFYLWGSAILIEVIAHVVRFQWEINDGIRLRSHGSVAERLCDITVIILGEASRMFKYLNVGELIAW
ncbi:low temperature requirement protein LtrA [Ceratobasidium sp. AG-Ba]|nr:low temperature requirement protein LtrA [Ceratobasidium sp. AG-Ba]